MKNYELAWELLEEKLKTIKGYYHEKNNIEKYSAIALVEQYMFEIGYELTDK